MVGRLDGLVSGLMHARQPRQLASDSSVRFLSMAKYVVDVTQKKTMERVSWTNSTAMNLDQWM